ncbi:heptosyltransferase I [Mariprofundus micogutta]|uniref:Lipopolysaccharide heptosyltransferase 1 n=1 Tax=Mariprofundus micogutta TaxID=1921010 RepID=A0A1L8CN00_9PROT|nr:lipopolysaccharide heptosyltransferase I [Mariprofundus micogutta]GAV20295.1 heptosyltransferase I [Mariprofundus micogutta]
MKILIVKLSAFGDIIHALPALDDVLNHPLVEEVHWLVDSRYGFVTDIFPARVQVHQVALKGDQPLQSAWAAIKKLRRKEFDAVLDLQGLMKSAVLARACGSPVYAFDKRFVREKPAALLTRNVRFHDQDRHVVQQYRRIATAPFIADFNQPENPLSYRQPQIRLSESHCTSDKNLLGKLGLQERQYVILHAAGGWATKKLPEETWLTIARGLADKDLLPLFSWGNETEAAQAKSFAGKCNGYALPERLNMSALCSLIGGARAVVGADTGLLHLAAALNRPTITFWGPSASWNSAPLSVRNGSTDGAKHWQIESNPDCGPCFKRTCDNFVCMNAISAESILRILHEL